jgi:hypothetical protein
MNTILKFYGILTAVMLTGVTVGTASSGPLMEHELNIVLKPSAHWLQATDEVTITQANEPYLSFTLAPHLRLDALTLDGRSVRYTSKNGWIRVPWRGSDNGRRLRIDYVGRFDDGVPEAPLNSDNPGYGVSGTIGPRGTMLLAGAGWYPRARSGQSTYRISVDAPEGVVAVTSGKSLGHSTENGRTISRWGVDQPLRGIALVAGNFTVSTQRFGNISAATYFTAPLQHLSDDYLNATGRYLELYQEMFGPYPFGQFAVVENFFPTGYGFPSFTLMGRRVLQLPFIIRTSLGHEIAHCWWGNGVLVDPSQGNWSEGLTTYVADYFYKERQGQGRAYRLQWLRNYAALVTPSNQFALSRFASRVDPATKAVGYDKAAMVFHMLRQAVGDEAFWATLRDIYTRHRFEAVTWSDFRAAFEVRSTLSLERFFDQWVFRPGAPRLSLADVKTTPTASGYAISGSVSQEKPFYDLDLDLAVTTEMGETLHAVTVTGARTPFSINIDRQPQALTADPDVHLFRQLHPSEMPPTINALKGAPSVMVVVADDLDTEGDRVAGRLVAALGLDNARIGGEKDFSFREMRNNNLIFIGNSTSRQWRPANGAQFALTPQAIVLNGHGHDRQKSSFFGVFANPQNKDRTAALFIPANLTVATVLSTKIPHYGKYSYLVFDDTRNQVKGTWAADHSPMVVKWSGDSNSRIGGS